MNRISKIIEKYFDAVETNNTDKSVAVFPQEIVNEYCGDDIRIWGESLKDYTITSFNSLSTVSAAEASKALDNFHIECDYDGTVDNIAEVVVEAEFENTSIDNTTYEFIFVQRDGVWELWYVDDSIGWIFRA